MELNILKSKKLIFNIEIANVDVTNVKGTFVLFLDDSFNIGISANVENGKLAVIVPPLDKFDFKEGVEYKAELWVIANRDYYTIPWSEKVIIRRPIDIKTSIKKVSESGEEPYVLVTKPIVIKE
jgi:hypothetical protein